MCTKAAVISTKSRLCGIVSGISLPENQAAVFHSSSWRIREVKARWTEMQVPDRRRPVSLQSLRHGTPILLYTLIHSQCLHRLPRRRRLTGRLSVQGFIPLGRTGQPRRWIGECQVWNDPGVRGLPDGSWHVGMRLPGPCACRWFSRGDQGGPGTRGEASETCRSPISRAGRSPRRMLAVHPNTELTLRTVELDFPTTPFGVPICDTMSCAEQTPCADGVMQIGDRSACSPDVERLCTYLSHVPLSEASHGEWAVMEARPELPAALCVVLLEGPWLSA